MFPSPLQFPILGDGGGYIKNPALCAGVQLFIIGNNSKKAQSIDYAPPPAIIICINYFHLQCKYGGQIFNWANFFDGVPLKENNYEHYHIRRYRIGWQTVGTTGFIKWTYGKSIWQKCFQRI